MYTSGTTGDPKGVILTNRAVVAEVITTEHLVLETDKAVKVLPSTIDNAIQISMMVSRFKISRVILAPVVDLWYHYHKYRQCISLISELLIPFLQGLSIK